MKPRHRRFAWIGAGLLVLGIAAALVLKAFQRNLVFFYTPSQVIAHEAPDAQLGRTFRIGGLVTAGSVVRLDGRDAGGGSGGGGDDGIRRGLTVKFAVTDTVQTIPVEFAGILPDLFREGKGVVAQGKLGADGIFHASQVFAKHDENYMPPEAAEALKKAGHPLDAKMFSGQKTLRTTGPKS